MITITKTKALNRQHQEKIQEKIETYYTTTRKRSRV